MLCYGKGDWFKVVRKDGKCDVSRGSGFPM